MDEEEENESEMREFLKGKRVEEKEVVEKANCVLGTEEINHSHIIRLTCCKLHVGLQKFPSNSWTQMNR